MTRHHPRTNTLESAALYLESAAIGFAHALSGKMSASVVRLARVRLHQAAVDYMAMAVKVGITAGHKRK